MKTVLILRICLILLSICFISYVSCENQIVLNPQCQSEEATESYKKTLFVFMIGGVAEETNRKKTFYVLKQVACLIPKTDKFKFSLLDYASNKDFDSNVYDLEEFQKALESEFEFSTTDNPCDKYKEGLNYLKDTINIPGEYDNIQVIVQISTSLILCRTVKLFEQKEFDASYHFRGIKLTSGNEPDGNQKYIGLQYNIIEHLELNGDNSDFVGLAKKFIDGILESRKNSPTAQLSTTEETKTPTEPTPTTEQTTTIESTITTELKTTETPIPVVPTDPSTTVQTIEPTTGTTTTPTTEGTTSEAIIALAAVEPAAEGEEGSNAWIYVIVILLIILIIIAALVVAFCYVRRKKKPEECRLLPTVTASETKSKSIVIEPPTVTTSPAVTPSPVPSPMPKVFPVAKKRSAPIVSTVKVEQKDDNEDALAFLKNKKREDVEREKSTLSTSITLESICDRKKKVPGSKDLQKTQSLPSADKK